MPSSEPNSLPVLLEGAGFRPVTDRAFLRITGSDATRWLNGMVSNSIQALEPGEGNYNFLLNAQGRIQGDATIYRDPTADPAEFVLETDKSQIDTVEQMLDKFIIMDDVQLAQVLFIEGVVEARSGVLIIGAKAPDAVRKVISDRWEQPFAEVPKPGTMVRGRANGAALVIFTPAQAGVPTYEVWCEDEKESGLLQEKLLAMGVSMVDPETLEQHRILSAAPKYGQDIRNTETARDLPQETAQTHALHFAKGCYLGQEIVERIRSRGQVHRRFTAFRLTGELPATLPAPLVAGGKPAGELTSAALIPLAEGPVLVALGYVRQEAVGAKLELTYSGGIAVPAA
jgi:folate-binding protein YgfZ